MKCCPACGSEQIEKKEDHYQCLSSECGQAFIIKDNKAKPAKSVLDDYGKRLDALEGGKNKNNEDAWPI